MVNAGAEHSAPPRSSSGRLPGIATAGALGLLLLAVYVFARHLGTGGEPYAAVWLPVAAALTSGALVAAAYRGSRSERAVVTAVSAAIGAALGAWLVAQAPLSPRELARRVHALAGPDVHVVSVHVHGAAGCHPCASADVVLQTAADTVDRPLVLALAALKRVGLADTLLSANNRPDESTAAGSSSKAFFSLRAVPETVHGRLQELVVLRVQARR